MMYALGFLVALCIASLWYVYWLDDELDAGIWYSVDEGETWEEVKKAGD